MVSILIYGFYTIYGIDSFYRIYGFYKVNGFNGIYELCRIYGYYGQILRDLRFYSPGGTPQGKWRVAPRKFLKTPLKGSRFYFEGVTSNSITPLRGVNSEITN